MFLQKKEHKENSGSGGYTQCLGCDNDITDEYVCPNLINTYDQELFIKCV